MSSDAGRAAVVILVAPVAALEPLPRRQAEPVRKKQLREVRVLFADPDFVPLRRRFVDLLLQPFRHALAEANPFLSP